MYKWKKLWEHTISTSVFSMQIMKNSRNIVENLAATAPFNIIDIILATGGHLDGKVGT